MLTIYNDPLFMGFGDFGSRSSSGNLNPKTSYVTNFEAGLKQQFHNGKPLYKGLFFDYDLTNMLSKSDDALVDYKTN